MKHPIKHLWFVLLTLLSVGTSTAQTFDWIKGGGSASSLGTGGSGTEGTYKMCTDPHGNIYALNLVANGTVYADTFSQSGTGGTGLIQNLLFTSHTCNGQMRFAKLVSCTNPIEQGIVADSFGNVYLAMDLRHGSSGPDVLKLGYDTTITAFNYCHQALVKYDTSGHLHWIRLVGDNTPFSYNAIGWQWNNLVLDSAQNPHLVVHNRYGGVVFRPGDTSRHGVTDLKYDPAGNLVTVKHFNCDSFFVMESVSIDPGSNKLYATGSKVVPVPPTSAIINYRFLAAFDTNRNLIWIDTLKSLLSPINYGFGNVVADGDGYLYASGRGGGAWTAFKTDTAFNTLSSSTSAGVNLIMKLDTAGNVRWMTTFSTMHFSDAFFQTVLMPDKRKIAASGHIVNKIKCDIDSIAGYAGEQYNPFFTVLDTAGYVHELQQLHAPGLYDGARSVATDRIGNVFVGGLNCVSVWGGALPPYGIVGGNSDFFITKYGVDCNCLAMPIADFTAVQTGSHTYNFTYTGTPGDSVRWYFGDGSPITTSLTPTHVFSSSGTFTVRCWVYTACGRDMKAIRITLPCTYPGGASFTHTGISTIAFTYTGSMTDVDSIRWSFGDGGTSPLTSPSHTYTAVGSYLACVKVYSWCTIDIFCTTITVPCIGVPSVTFTSPGSIHDSTKNFTYTSSITGVDSVRWDFGDGTGFTGSPATHSYGDTGTYVVCAIAYSQCGNDTACKTVVYHLPLDASSFIADNILVYPNPASDQLVIENAAGSEMKIFDVLGREVLRATIKGKTAVIDIKQLESGVYVVQFSNEVGVKVVRVVKK